MRAVWAAVRWSSAVFFAFRSLAARWLNTTAATVDPTAVMRTRTASVARAGFRRHQRQARPAAPTGRASIGSPASHRSSSSATDSADAYAPCGVFFQALEGDRLQVAVGDRIDETGPDRLAFLDLAQCLRHRLTPERRPARQCRVEDRAKPVDVGSDRHRPLVTRRLFGRHVAGRAEDRTRLRQLTVGLDPLGQAEVGHVRLTPRVEQHVGRFQVAVEDAALVGMVDGPRYLSQSPGRLPRRVHHPVEPPIEASAVEQSHAEVMVALMLAHLVDRHDVRVVEVGHGLGLDAEPVDIGRAGEPAGQDHLQGHHTVQADLPRLVDDPHPAAGDLLKQLVVAEVGDQIRFEEEVVWSQRRPAGPEAERRHGVGRPVASRLGRRVGSRRPGSRRDIWAAEADSHQARRAESPGASGGSAAPQLGQAA